MSSHTEVNENIEYPSDSDGIYGARPKQINNNDLELDDDSKSRNSIVR